MEWVHVTSRLIAPDANITDPEPARWLWSHLQAGFPSTLAAVLMPTHLHLVLVPELLLARKIGSLLGNFTRRFANSVKSGTGWTRIVLEPFGDRARLARVLRYVILNPCRGGHSADPLTWPWSSLRDVIGAIAQPWVTSARLAEALGDDRRQRDVAKAFHAFVTSDPSVRSGSAMLPVPAPPRVSPQVGVQRITQAVLAATRGRIQDVEQRGSTRDLLLALARHQGWTDSRSLAAIASTTKRTVERARSRNISEAALAAAALCLGDDRLLLVDCPRRTRGPLLRSGD
jgi:hypothetical protein